MKNWGCPLPARGGVSKDFKYKDPHRRGGVTPQAGVRPLAAVLSEARCASAPLPAGGVLGSMVWASSLADYGPRRRTDNVRSGRSFGPPPAPHGVGFGFGVFLAR